jgi:hypothetical protein
MAEFGQEQFKTILHDSLDYKAEKEMDRREDYNFASLQQWDTDDKRSLGKENRPALTFDRTMPLIQSVSGSQVTQRYQVAYLPRDSSLSDVDRVVSSPLSQYGRWVQQTGDFEQYESLAFKDNLIGGYGSTEMMISYDENPDGQIGLKRVIPQEITWDPASVEPNNADARWIIRDKWIDEDELASMFGAENAEEVARAAGSISEPGVSRSGLTNAGNAGGTTHTTEQRYAYDLTREPRSEDKFYDPRTHRVRLFECQRFERRYRTRIIAPDFESPMFMMALEAGKPPPVVEYFEERENVKERLASIRQASLSFNQGPNSTIIPDPIVIEDFPVRIYTRSFHTNSEMLKLEQLPVGGFTYEFMTCFEDWSQETRRHWMGLMRRMKDPQRYANKFLSQSVHLYTANPKGGFMFEEGLFVDDSEAAQAYNMATGWMPVKKGKLTNSAKPPYVQLASNVHLNQAEGLMAHAINSVAASVGLSEAYFVGGAQDLRRTSGQAVSSVLSQNLKSQSTPFDSLRLYRKRIGRLMLGFIDAYVDPKQIERVVGAEDAAPIIQSLGSGDLQNEYDIVVEEVPTSPNERQEVFDVLMQSGFLPQMMSQGMPIPPSLAEFFPIPANATAELQASLQSSYDLQMANMEMQNLQLQMQLQAVKSGVPMQPPPMGGEEEVPS